MLYTKELEIKYDVDVLVTGGGAAGVAAAVAAARSGKKVLICERDGAFGGMGTSGLVPAFAPFTDGKNIVCGGIGLEIRKNVSRNFPVESYWTTIETEELKREYDRIILDSGAQFLFFTQMCDAVSDGNGNIKYVVFTSPTGIFAVTAKIYIDCTGNGELAAFAGAEFQIGDEKGNVMPPTLCSLWNGVDPKTHRGAIHLEQAIANNAFTYPDRHVPGFFLRRGKYYGYAGGNLGHIFGNNPLNSESNSKAMVIGRKQATEFENYYKNYESGCDDLKLLATANTLGIRESRRIVCDYMLNAQDFVKRATFSDEIGRYCYPVDIHVMNTDITEYQRFKNEYGQMRYNPGESYGIPYRSLIPKGFNNLIVAGRCVCTDRSMEASLRVMPGCFITGQAAGTAAALAVDAGNTRKIEIKSLRQNLAKNGAYLG